VPNVAGQTESEAREAITAALAVEEGEVAWEITTESEYSDGVASGVVIRTEPPGESSLADDGTLTLVVSDGPEPVPVPTLVDVDQAGAEAAIIAAELEVGEVTHEFSETIPVNQVTGWSVDGEEKPTEAPKGSAVDFRISDGPEPRTIPELDGATPEEAEAELAELGLNVARREEFSEDVEAGQLIGTDPAAGTQVSRGDTVTLIISKGPDLVAVPDVVGMSLDEAVETLEAAGFSVNAEGPPRGTVFESDPSAGARVKRGTEVTIYLRR
jgi:serine/threonine-protein kinase